MVYYFGECILDEARYELRRAGAVVAIEPKAFQVLVYLIEHRERMVSRHELLEHCWPDTFVSESALTQCLTRVRKAVGAQRGGRPLIKTVHGHGYRFVAPLLSAPGVAMPSSEASQHQAGVETLSPASAQLLQPSETQQEGPDGPKSGHTADPISTPTLSRQYRDLFPPQGGTPLAEHRSRAVLCAEGVAEVPPRGLSSFVGRKAEMAMLRERWERVKEGLGQVVLLHGEAGIGKSRLVQQFTEQIAAERHTRFECRCSPYHQYSAWYPVTELLTRTLALDGSATPDDKLRQLEQFLDQTHLALAETVPFFAALLALPLPTQYAASLALSPQQQHRKTLEALLALLLAYAAQQPVLLIVEDAQWIDPSTLELLSRLIDQGPTARLLLCVVCRPEFQSPWGVRAHVTPMVLNRLPRHQVADMIGRLTGGKPLPPEVVQQLLAKTDGVPLFVEELTKMVLESGLLKEGQGHYELTGPLPALAIPTTLHDSLMARLDRLGTARGVVQLGAVLGRQFAFELLQAVSQLEEEIVQRELSKAVEAELLYQQGLPPRAIYVFKHDLIRDTAYQALLKRTRQQYHQRTAQVLAERFPEIAETQPELVAHHYTEAGLAAPAVVYWQRAGQCAIECSANLEAAQHLTKGLELLATLSETQARAQQELDLQLALGPVLAAIKSWATPEVEQAYARARVL